jgi:glycosyltransferase involved in cell wall biosynthesis
VNFNTGIVVFNHGAFGGAAKRYTNLFLHLNKLYPGKFFYIVNRHLEKQIADVYDNFPQKQLRIVDFRFETSTLNLLESDKVKVYNDSVPDPDVIDRKTFLPKKVYWFYKNRSRQKKLFRQIEEIRKKENIRVFCGVFSGILPLVFYMGLEKRIASVIFSDMDSWFTDVMPDTKKFWYRKYYSFNYALENSDVVDFLSPYILEGIKSRGIKLPVNSVSVSPCSFADYSKCKAGNKSEFSVAFASRLEPDKNPMVYLEAAKLILSEYPEIKFYILGEGTLSREIEKFIDKYSLNKNINFTFHCNPPEIFAETSIFVSLQSNTNYPSQSVLEAMACGNAIIASNRGDTILFINEDNGILTDINPLSVRDAIVSLYKNKQHLRELGENAKRFSVSNHTAEKFTDYFITLLNKAADRIE